MHQLNFYIFLHLALLYLIPTSNASVHPLSLGEAINWTAANVDTNNGWFYNAPAGCQLPASNWTKLKYPDGSSYTGSKRPIVLLFDQKDSSILATHVVQYLLQSMGYNVQVVTRLKYILGPEFSLVDLELEIWQNDFQDMNQITRDGSIVNIGNTGYNGNFGLYVPSYMLDDNPDISLDFWRFLSKASEMEETGLPKAGSGPYSLVNGVPVCDKMAGVCKNGSYVPAQCKTKGSQCFELWHYDTTFAPSMYQRIVDGLNLSLVINFLGAEQAPKIIQSAIDKRKPVLFFNWTPSSFVASNDLSRVMFPLTNSKQYNTFRKNKTIPLTSDPAATQIRKLASAQFMADFPELNSFVSQIRISDENMNAMLKSKVVNKWGNAEAACDWINNTMSEWKDWMPKVPKSAAVCPIGKGRYLTGITYSCITCPTGSYNWKVNNTAECLPCPNGFDCLGGSQVNVLQGQWMPNDSLVPTSYICPSHEACCIEESCPPLTCQHKFTGLLCTECKAENEYIWGNECHKCSSYGGASFYVLILVAFFCSFLVLLLPYEEAPTVELLFFYFQVARYIFETQVNGILSVPGISTFLSIAALNVDGFVTDCPLPVTGVNKLLFRFFLPLLMLFYIVSLYYFLRILQARFSSVGQAIVRWTPYWLKGDSVSLICFRAVIITMTFIIMPLVDSSLLLLQCQTIEGKNVLTQAPQIECFSAQHVGAAAFAIIIISIMMVGLPLGLAYLLYRLWKGDMIKFEHSGLSPLQKLFQCLYIIFKPELFFMMPVTILEKGLVSVLFTLMSRYTGRVQMNVYVMVLSLLCATRIYIQPFSNHLEAYLNREIALGILAMIGLRQYTDQYGVSTLTLLEIGLVIFLPPFLHIIRWTQGNYHKHKEVIHEVVSKRSRNGSRSGGSSSFSGVKSLEVSTQSVAASATGTAITSRSLIAHGAKGSIEKLSCHSRSNTVRSMTLSRKTTVEDKSRKPDEQIPLNITPAP
ncbi:hypothetical protein BDR26DRAFT_851369 [Obelidium mucronatum]|nr:hypothetical protein BDR26DRAFT_851369 [Obelidium mucronatum]